MSKLQQPWLWPLLALALVACGSKSPLRIPHFDEDAGTFDAGMDAGVDAGVDAGLDAGPDAGPMPDECIELPFRDPPSELRVSFTARILTADVFFLVDVTGSMSEEIDQIRTQLREEIIPGLAAEIPDIRFGVGHFADFDEGDFGSDGDQVFRLLQSSTADVGAVQRAVDRLPLQGGLDFPEAMVQALYLTATGQGHGRFVPASSCPDGTLGYPCFRSDGSRIILAFTDAPTHNGPGGSEPYFGVRPRPHTYEEAVDALRDIGAKVLGLHSGSMGFEGGGRADLEALARDTGAVRPDGTPVVFDIGTDGSFLSDSVVEAVRTLVDEVPIGDVSVRIEDHAGDDVDTELFVDEVVALSATPPDGAVNLGDRFADVRPGTRLTFQILLRNDEIPQTDEPQSFLMNVVLLGDEVTRLQETLVQIVVPARGGGVVCP
ncbi:MAG TPA: vWA domain-containing protein [Sandaracinaceae bacterium LLY-WYZ-13_1]|nr:vWA domain-containing protein [Sandaracinaceae bacterium LLY-WYZ-13_1]